MVHSHCQTPTPTLTTVSSIEICRTVHTAQILTQTQITMERIVVCIGVGVGVWQCEHTMKPIFYRAKYRAEFHYV